MQASERDDECDSTLPDLITDDSRDVLIFPSIQYVLEPVFEPVY